MLKVDFTIHLNGIDYTNNQGQLIKDIFFKYGKQHFDPRFRTKLQAFKRHYDDIKKRLNANVIPQWSSDIRDWNLVFQANQCLKMTINNRQYYPHIPHYSWISEEAQKSYAINAIQELIINNLIRLGAVYVTRDGFTKSDNYFKSWMLKVIRKHMVITITNMEPNN